MRKIHQAEEGHCPTSERSTEHQVETLKARRDAAYIYQATHTETLRCQEDKYESTKKKQQSSRGGHSVTATLDFTLGDIFSNKTGKLVCNTGLQSCFQTAE